MGIYSKLGHFLGVVLSSVGKLLPPLGLRILSNLFGSTFGQDGNMKIISIGYTSICKTIVCWVAIPLWSAALVLAQDQPQRPKSEDLLPETTVVYVQLENTRDLVEKLSQSTIGQMLADEKIAPLAQELYAQAQEAYAEVQNTVGLSLEEIQSLPSGEVCFAIVAPRRKDPAYVLIIDTDPESEAFTKAMDRAHQLAEENGIEIEKETNDDEIEFETMNVQGQQVTTVRKDGTLVASTSREVLDDLLERWMERTVEKDRPLSSNRKFVTIMNRCRGTKDTPPEIRFFVDPIALARSALRGNAGAQAGLNFLPVLGLDGLLAVGGTSLFNEQEFESVSHMHILLSNPRAGLFEMLALKPGDYRPQSWVPNNTTNFMTTSWDIEKMYVEFAKIYDTFSGEGGLEKEVQKEINDELGLDLREDILGSLSGRITYVQWVEGGKRINDTINALGIELRDRDKFQKVVDTIIAKIRSDQGEGEDPLTEEDYKGHVFYRQPDSRIERQRERMENRRRDNEQDVQMDIRLPQPCFGIVGNDVIITDSVEFMKRAIETDRGDEPGLADDQEFMEIGRKMTRLLGTDVPAALLYSDPEETMRMFFNVAKSDNSKNMLEKLAEENERARGFRDAFANHPLPDFDDIKRYFRPSGAFITNDDTGYHLLGFQLRSDTADSK